MKKITDYFNESILQSLSRKKISHKPHPLIYFSDIESGARISKVDKKINAITKLAFHTLSKSSDETRKFLDKVIPIISGNDIINAYATLAEVRAYSDLLRSGFTPHYINDPSKPTADFQISLDDQIINIEVHCKQMSGKEAEDLRKHDEWISKQTKKKKSPGVTFYEHVVKPFGGKDRETIAENVASKIAQVKSKSKQGNKKEINIIWMDFIDPDMWSLDSYNCQPLFTSASMFFSGGIWAGFYGKKNMSLFDGTPISKPVLSYTIQKMRFDGRFRNTENIFNFAVLSFSDEKIIFENPWSKTKNVTCVYTSLLRIIDINFPSSWINCVRSPECWHL